MPSQSQFSRGHSLSLPDAVKSRLSSAWVKCLELMGSRRFTDVSCHKILGEPKDGTKDGGPSNTESWEEVLTVLGTEDAVEVDGNLILLPTFLSLPAVLQVRFLFLMGSFLSKISSRVIKTFLEKLHKCPRQNLWLKEALRQIENILDCSSVEMNRASFPASSKYEFSHASKSMLNDVLNEIGKRSTQEGQHQRGTTEKVEEIEVITLNGMNSHLEADTENLANGAGLSSIEAAEQQCLNQSVVDVDVIVIEDSNDNENFSHKFGKKPVPSDDTERKDIPRYSTKCEVDDNNVDKMIFSSRADSNSGHDCVNTLENSENQMVSVSKMKEKHASGQKMSNSKRKSTMQGDHSLQQIEMVSHPEEPVQKKLKAEEDINLTIISEIDENATIFQDDTHLDHPDSTTTSILPESIQISLGSLREACSCEGREFVINSDMLSCFLHLNVSQIEAACAFLNPQKFSEEALVIICDNMPWPSLGLDTTLVLLESCFYDKLKHLQSPASQTLLTAVKSVAKIQPKVMTEVFTHALDTTNSGVYQCQVLASACKDSFAQDTFSHLIRKLSVKNLTMNEHLVSVLQILMDKRADLDSEAVSGLLSLMTRGAQEMASSPKFGKLLMSLVSKYSKKMSGAQLTTTCAIVDAHSSSLKRSLQAALKRVT